MLLQNGEPEVPSNVLSLKLQYAQSATCESASVWNDVWDNALSWEDWHLYDNAWVVDWSTLTDSLLFWGGHVLQTYSESIPTLTNPNAIPVHQWAEWDFSLEQESTATWSQYCFRVVTENDSEIEYSSYAIIDTTDTVDPVISSYTPDNDSLFPIWNFEISYNFSDADSWIDTDSDTIYLQRWDGIAWWSDIAGTYISLDTISSTDALFNVTGLPYGRYQVWFEISDNTGNSSFVIHELYVDDIEFIISRWELDIWVLSSTWALTSSDDILTVTVKTVWAAFDVTMFQQSDMTNGSDIIEDWNGVKWFWYNDDPFNSVNSFGTWNIVLSQIRDLNPDGEKYTYSVDLKYSALVDIFDISAWDYESLLDFTIDLDYN